MDSEIYLIHTFAFLTCIILAKWKVYLWEFNNSQTFWPFMEILDIIWNSYKNLAETKTTYRHGDFGEIFPYAVLHNAPEIQTVVWFGRDHGSPDPAPARNSGGFSCHQLGLPIPLGITVGISFELRFYTCCRLEISHQQRPQIKLNYNVLPLIPN